MHTQKNIIKQTHGHTLVDTNGSTNIITHESQPHIETQRNTITHKYGYKIPHTQVTTKPETNTHRLRPACSNINAYENTLEHR